ncbi:unnamed protein product [Larinioides sclopetarius]|uniref:Uncharacterized protein n=1 Tax=Larinioides sclopetarius TaxID=280406 RepID=A0AAV2AKK3_9ARAC
MSLILLQTLYGPQNIHVFYSYCEDCSNHIYLHQPSCFFCHSKTIHMANRKAYFHSYKQLTKLFFHKAQHESDERMFLS